MALLVLHHNDLRFENSRQTLLQRRPGLEVSLVRNAQGREDSRRNKITGELHAGPPDFLFKSIAMLTKYEHTDGYAMGYMVQGTENFYWLADLYVQVTKREKGVGTLIMQTICDDADTERVHIYLHAMPPQIENLDRLIEFYERFGFVEMIHKMHRAPILGVRR